MAIVLTAGTAKALDFYLIGRISDAASKYNLKRILKLITVLVIALIVISIRFRTWYTALVSLGLVSLILGFALQTPISSFIAWIYILVPNPYRVGDRIKIGEAMLERVRTFRSLLSETPVDRLEVREYPAVLFRVSNNTWLEAG